MKKIKHPIILSVSIIGLLLIVAASIGAFMYFGSSESENFQAKNEGYVVQSIFYDASGERIQAGTPQTTVQGVPGIFYMSLIVKVSNTGNTILNNVRMIESHPAEFQEALQSALPIKSTLAIGESNVVEWNTANSCTDNAQCASTEKCVNSLCLIDISNFIGQITFGMTLAADFKDAQGQTQSTNTLINLPISFEQDGILLRFEKAKESAITVFRDSWLVYDNNGDGILEAYGAGSGTNLGGQSCVGSADSKFISYYGIFVAQKAASGTDIYFCRENGVSDEYVTFKTDDSDASRAVTTNTPIEPYTSSLCSGSRPCREIYKIQVQPPAQICGDGLITGTEVCETSPLNVNGETCASVAGAGSTGTLGCAACASFDTTNCVVPGQNVRYRTTSLTYASSEAVGYTATCGNTLTAYGYTGGSGLLTNTCAAAMATSTYCGSPATLLQNNLPGGWQSGGAAPSLWQSSVAGRVCVCDDGSDGKYAVKKYETADPDASKVATTPSEVTAANELSC